jgi:hypothetical protein
MNDYDVIIFDRALRVLAAFRCQYGDRSSLKKLPRVAAFDAISTSCEAPRPESSPR